MAPADKQTRIDDAQPWLDSMRRSRRRRAAARRERLHRLRVRGSSTSLVVVAVMVASIGAGAAVGHSGSSSSARSTAQVLKVGSRGASVAALQRALGVAADGVFGPQTRRAVRRFQRRKGLAVDGIAGLQTLRALGITVRAPRSRGGSSMPAVLQRIAQCESGGNPRAVSPDGRYRGKYQFSRATWRSLGGTGDPARASEAVQDRMALKLYRQQGTAPWPNCG